MIFLKEKIEKYYLYIAVFLCLLILAAVFDRVLTMGLIFLSFLVLAALAAFSKFKVKDKNIYRLFFIVLIIYLAGVLFIHYFNFQPFSKGVGDYRGYQAAALRVADNFQQGNFSLRDPSYQDPRLDFRTFLYPVTIGVIYIFTLPEMLIGQLFNVWLAALAVVLVYQICREMGGSEKGAFLVGLLAAIYPSFLFYSSLLLKEALVVFTGLAGLWLCLKLIKNFSWKKFILFYAILVLLIHLRLYAGYALLFSFIVSRLWLARLKPRAKKIALAIFLAFILGFAPMVWGEGYYGIKSFENFFFQKYDYYQEEAYSPFDNYNNAPEGWTSPTGFDSTWTKEPVSFKKQPLKFIVNQIKYFLYVLLGPLPWQIKKPLHLLALFELIPWYILLFFVGKGTWQAIKNRNNLIITIIIFSVLFLGVMSLFFNNFGVITRIRILAFIPLLGIMPLGRRIYGKD